MFIALEASGVSHSFRSAMLVEKLLLLNGRVGLLFFRRIPRNIALLKSLSD
jgi:hypothetical protein